MGKAQEGRKISNRAMLQKPVSSLDLSKTILAKIYRYDIGLILDLVKQTRNFFTQRNFSKEEIFSIEKVLWGKGLCLGMVEVEEKKEEPLNGIMKESIVDLNLPEKIFRRLYGCDITCIGKLVEKDEEFLLRHCNFSRETISLIQEVLMRRRLYLGMKLDSTQKNLLNPGRLQYELEEVLDGKNIEYYRMYGDEEEVA